MRMTDELIEQNNNKREDLNEENLAVYEDFLVYVRTDLRIDEHASEEVLMDLLDHLLEGQHYGKSAAEVFGSNPKAYADELIENLPREKKRSSVLFAISQVAGLAGWFSLTYGVINLLISLFKPVETDVSLGHLLSLLVVITGIGFVGVVLFFKIMRSMLFKPKKKSFSGYVKAGLAGGGAFAVMMLAIILIPEFGPVISIEWWMFIIAGLLLLAASKIISGFSRK